MVSQSRSVAAEEIDVWVDCRRMLARRRDATEYSMRYEEIHSINANVEANGSNQSSMIDETKTRALSNGWARCRVKAGSSGTSYVVIVKITTSLARVIEARAIMKVQDTDES